MVRSTPGSDRLLHTVSKGRSIEDECRQRAIARGQGKAAKYRRENAPLAHLGAIIAARAPSAQGLAGVAIIIAVVGYMATIILALGLVIDAVFGVVLTTGIWLRMGITLAYSVAGGILAGVYTDVFQGR